MLKKNQQSKTAGNNERWTCYDLNEARGHYSRINIVLIKQIFWLKMWTIRDVCRCLKCKLFKITILYSFHLKREFVFAKSKTSLMVPENSCWHILKEKMIDKIPESDKLIIYLHCDNIILLKNPRLLFTFTVEILVFLPYAEKKIDLSELFPHKDMVEHRYVAQNTIGTSENLLKSTKLTVFEHVQL